MVLIDDQYASLAEEDPGGTQKAITDSRCDLFMNTHYHGITQTENAYFQKQGLSCPRNVRKRLQSGARRATVARALRPTQPKRRAIIKFDHDVTCPLE